MGRLENKQQIGHLQTRLSCFLYFKQFPFKAVNYTTKQHKLTTSPNFINRNKAPLTSLTGKISKLYTIPFCQINTNFLLYELIIFYLSIKKILILFYVYLSKGQIIEPRIEELATLATNQVFIQTREKMLDELISSNFCLLLGYKDCLYSNTS